MSASSLKNSFACVAAIAILLLSAVLSSCTKDVGRYNKGNYPDDIDGIISSNCATSGCHNPLSKEAAGNFDLETWESMFRGSRNGSPVVPYSSRFSSLCYYINTFDELGTQNKPTMPLNRAPLSFDQVKRFRDWIDAGAPAKSGEVKWADDPQRKKFYAVNQGCDVVTVFDAESRLPMRFIEAGKGQSSPHQVRVSPDGKYWYVIFINRNVMSKYRCSDDGFEGEIPLTPAAAGTGPEDAGDWNTFVISADGRFAYVVSWKENGLVSKVDLVNRKLVRMMGGLYYPHAIALHPSGDRIYVATQSGNYISEIDSSMQDFKNDYSLDENPPVNFSGLEPHDLIFSPDASHLWIACQKSNEVRVFDLSSKKTVKILPSPVYPQEIMYSPRQKKYYVTCMGDGSVQHQGSLMSISENFDVNSIKCGAQPHGLAEDSQKELMYVLSRNISTNGPIPHHSSQCNGRNGFVNFVDLRTFTVLKEKMEISVDPYFIAARP